MGHDSLSPVAPARVRCLLLPCGKIKRSRFSAFVERLQQVKSVRLGDISPNGRPNRTMFSPLAFPTGLIVYEMLLSSPWPSQLALVPFELYREPLAIVAIADGTNWVEAGDGLDDQSVNSTESGQNPQGHYTGTETVEDLLTSVMDLKEHYPAALVHQVFIFDCDKADSAMPASLVPVPSLENSKTTTMKTVMCDLTSLLLAEMTTYAKSIQALPNIETPKPTQSDRYDTERNGVRAPQADGFSRPGSRISSIVDTRSSSPAREIERSHRASIPAHLTSTPFELSSTREGSQPRSQSIGIRPPPVTFDEIDRLPDASSTSAEVAKQRQSSKERVPVHGFGSGSFGERARNKAKGRVGVVLGSMYLLAGRWPDAIKELVDSASMAKANSDHAWHAKALDYILVCLLMCAWAGMDFEIPQICYPVGEKSSSASSKSSKHIASNSSPDVSLSNSSGAANRLVSLQNLCQLLPDLVNNILHLYVRAATFTAEQVPQVVFSESTIRLAKLLALIQVSRGTLNDRGLGAVVLNEDVPPPRDNGPSQIANFPTKSDIAAVVFRAFPASVAERPMDIRDRANILAGIASVLSKLGYHRKKAFILRELMSNLLPALIQSRKDSAAELGVHPAASLSSFDFQRPRIGRADYFDSTGSLEQGAGSFLIMICQVYGVVLSSSSYQSDSEAYQDTSRTIDGTSAETAIDNVVELVGIRALSQSDLRSFGNKHLKFDVLRSCINVSEAMPDLRGVLKFSGDLLRTAGSGIVPAIDSSDGSPDMSIEDQVRLSQNVSRTVSAARKLGLDHVEAEYWDEFLLRKVEIVKSTLAKAPTPYSKAHLEVAGELTAEKENGPFIYNPFLAKPDSSVAEAMLVAHEEAVFSVIVQNLYDFDVEIEWIKLDTSNVLLKTLTQGVVIGPYRTQTIHLIGIPKASGSLKICGCIAKIKGCRERSFPIFQTPWRAKQDGKIKRLGLSAAEKPKTRPISSNSDSVRIQRRLAPLGPIASTLAIKVIEPQPHVVIKSVSLPQSAIMLLEGETKRFTVTLHNVSTTIPVDLLLFTFTDSTMSSLPSSMINKELSSAAVYEAELSAYRNEAFRWRRQSSDQELSIAPDSDLSFEIEVLGKSNLTHGNIQIDYSHLGVSRTEVSDQFYTRQVNIPITVSIHASVSLFWNDFQPFEGDFAWRNKRQPLLNGSAHSTPPDKRQRAVSRPTTKTENRFQSLLERLGLGSHGDDHCLVLLDFRNTWPNPLSVSVQVCESLSKDQSACDPWKRAYTVHEILQPGHISRLVLLLPRLFLENPHAPVPSLNPANKRQYVVSTSKLSPDVERATRESFWYREEILKYIRASWQEDTTGRKGDISLRSLQLTLQMVQAIKLEDVAISLSLDSASHENITQNPTIAEEHDTLPTSSPPSDAVQQTGRSTYLLSTDTFLTLTSTIHNRLPHPISPLLRLQPSLLHNHSPHSALDLSKKFAFNGVLQRALPVIHAGETRVVRLGCTFLCKGEFEIGAVVEEIRLCGEESGKGGGGARARAAAGDLLGDDFLKRGSEKRRVWCTRETLRMVVRDSGAEQDEEEW